MGMEKQWNVTKKQLVCLIRVWVAHSKENGLNGYHEVVASYSGYEECDV